MANASDTYLSHSRTATFKRDLTFTDVDVSSLAAMSFTVCALPGAAPLLTSTPAALSSTVARVTITPVQLSVLPAGCYYYYFRITTVAAEIAIPEEGILTLTP